MLGQLVEFAIGAGLEAGRIGMLKDQCVGRAAEIARVQGWVSVGRLKTRMGLSLRDARFVLAVACQRGLLYEAVNGRFYPAASAAPTLTTASSATIFAPLPDEPTPTSNAVRSGRKAQWPAIVFCWAAVAIGGATWAMTRLSRPEAGVTVYHPVPNPDPTTLAPPAAAISAAVAAPTPAALDRQATDIPAKLNASPSLPPPQGHGGKKHPDHHREHKRTEH